MYKVLVQGTKKEESLSHTIRIQMGHQHNATALRDALPATYQVLMAQTALPEEAFAFDLCIIDEAVFLALRAQIREWKSRVAPLFLPALLVLNPKHESTPLSPQIWEFVDEVIQPPFSKEELHGRIKLLLRARQSSLELNEMYTLLDKASHTHTREPVS